MGDRKLAAEEKPAMKSARLAAAAFSAFFLSCTSQIPGPVPPEIRSQPAITSSWEEGTCSLRNNTLRYRSYSRQADLQLDVAVQNGQGRGLFCSSDLTVILTGDSAVVSLGGSAVLEGRLSLGHIGGIFTLANSYALDLRQINEEDGQRTSERVLDGRLHVATSRGRQWTIDLFNPERWDIY